MLERQNSTSKDEKRGLPIVEDTEMISVRFEPPRVRLTDPMVVSHQNVYLRYLARGFDLLFKSVRKKLLIIRYKLFI